MDFATYRKPTSINDGPGDGLLLPPRCKGYQPKELKSPPDEPDEEFSGKQNSGKAALGKMMASDDKKVKANPVPKAEAAPENKSTSVEPSKAEGGDTAAASPSGYSRGEGQKPVSKAYKDNWNVIFAKKKKR